MSDVHATLKVKPTGPDVDLDDLESEISDDLPAPATIQDTDEDPIGFGVSALVVLVEIPDAEGGADDVEATIDDLDDVQSVDVEQVTR